MENETVSRKSDLTLDLFDGEDQSAANKFHRSDVRLVDLKSNNIDDNGEESPYFNDIAAEESAIELKMVKSQISAGAFSSNVLAVEDDSAEEETPDKNFKEYIQQRGLTSIQEGKESEAMLEEDDDEATEEEEISETVSRTFSIMAKKFTIDSDIEEVDEEMEEVETPPAEDFQQPGRATMALASATPMVGTGALLIQAKSKLILRAASMLEQRLRTISGLKDLFEERKKLALKNRFLNDKCCEYLKKITTVNYFESTDGALPIHGNQRYYNVLEEFMEMKIHYDNRKPALEQKTQKFTDSYYIYRTRFEQVFEDFKSRELEVGFECIDGKTSKVLNAQKIHSLVKKQQRRFDQLAEVRVYYIKLQNRLASIHKHFRNLNLMSEGHTLMEYEQLVIIHNYSMDKLDERDEELGRFRNKCTEQVSILSYMKETANAFVHDIIDTAVKLEEVTKKKSEARSFLAVQRSKRDLLRKNTLKMRSTNGLLTSPRLLRKMEIDSQALLVLKRKVDRYRRGTVILKRSDNVLAKSETNGKSYPTGNQHIAS